MDLKNLNTVDYVWITFIVCGIGSILFVIFGLYPNKQKIQDNIDKEYIETSTKTFVNITNETPQNSLPYAFCFFFCLLLGFVFFRNKHVGLPSTETNVNDLITQNLSVVIPLFICSIVLILNTIITFMNNKKNTEKDKIIYSSKFLTETFIFSFLSTLGDNFSLLLHGNPITVLSMSFTFIFFFIAHCVLEYIGYYRWLYPVNEINKSCVYDENNGVDLTKCKKYDNVDTIDSQYNNYIYNLVFLVFIIFVVIILPSIKYFISKNNDDNGGIMNGFYNSTVGSIIICILSMIGTQFMNLNRSHTLLDTSETTIIGTKFLLHHLLWALSNLNKLSLF